MNFKSILHVTFLVLFSINSFAQRQTPPSGVTGNRYFFGGNFAMSFGNTGSYVDISPVIGYRFTEKFSAGAGPVYQYWSDRYFNLSGSNYGAKVFARQMVWRNAFAHTEYELLNTKQPYYYPSTNTFEIEQRFVSAFFVGGGINQSLGGSASLHIMALYDLLYNEKYSVRRSPVYLTMGFGFGF